MVNSSIATSTFSIDWILQTLVPILLTMSGWFFLYIINSKNMKSEKIISLKMHSYENIKDGMTETEKNMEKYVNS